MIHLQVIRLRFKGDLLLPTTLLDVYAKVGEYDFAEKVFDEMPQRDIVSWNTLIGGLAQRSCPNEALELLSRISELGLKANDVTVLGALSACSQLEALREGERVIRLRFKGDLLLPTTLLDVYAKVGEYDFAEKVFDEMPQRDIVSWNTLIGGLAQRSCPNEALELLSRISELGLKANDVTVLGALSACSQLEALREGERVIRLRFKGDLLLPTTLLDVYAKVGEYDFAEKVFDEMPQRDIVSWNTLIGGLAQRSCPNEALELLSRISELGLKANDVTVLGALSACSQLEALREGERVIRLRFKGDLLLPTTLLDVYAKVGEYDFAEKVFDEMPQRDIVSWNTLIGGLAQRSCPNEALELLSRISELGLKANDVTVLGALSACSQLEALREGERVIRLRFKGDLLLPTTLLDVYAKVGEYDFAEKVFDEMPQRDIVSWNTLIGGLAQRSCPNEALELLSRISELGLKANDVTVLGALSACSQLEALREGERVIRLRFKGDLLLPTTLLDVYAKVGEYDFAEKVFDEMPQRDIVSWNTLIGGLAQRSCPNEALELLSRISELGLKANDVTVLGALSACSQLEALREGERVIRLRFKGDLLLPTTLLDVYAKVGEYDFAEKVFDEMPQRDIVSWNTLIGGLAQRSCPNEALELLSRISELGLKANDVTVLGALSACSQLEALREGERVIRLRFKGDLLLPTTLLDVYAKVGEYDFAEKVFDEMPQRDIVSWNTLIGGLAQRSCPNEALELLSRISELGLKANDVTVLGALSACSQLEALREGERVIRLRFKGDLLLPTTLLDVYAKVGEYDFAEKVFDEMPQRDIVSWNTLIGGLAQRSCPNEALELLSRISELGLKANDVTVLGALSACSQLEALREGERVIRLRFKGDLLLPTTLLDVYAKVGEYDFAEKVFDEMPQRDIVSWNTLIGGLAQRSCPNEALELLSRISELGLKANDVTVLGALSACSQLEALREGERVIRLRFKGDLLLPTTLLDVYAKVGEYDFAEKVFDEMPQRDIVSWNTLIGGLAQWSCPNEALELLSRISELGLKANDVTVLGALSACSQLEALREGERVWCHIKDEGLDRNVVVCNAVIDM
ncbi:hypothetical protein Ancab_008027 [Ancistrocladus abbreviatus]